MPTRPLALGMLALGIVTSISATSITAAAAPLEEHATYGPLVESWASRMDLFDVPGAAIAVVEDGEAYVQTLGIRNEHGDPVTPETIFYIASITKTYLATLAAMLDERGTLSLDDPVKSYLPRFDVVDDEMEASITLGDLLCHRPGINSGEIVLLDAYTGEITEDRYYHWLSMVTPTGETTYTNVHFTLAGRVIEAVTDADWRDALDRELFTPAGLDRTTGYASEMYGDADSATPLERDRDGFTPVPQRKTDRTMHAAGGLGTTISDVARYLRIHLARGTIDGTRLFSEETAGEIQREHSTHEPNGSLRVMTGFGLGWQRGTFNDVPFLAHGGGYDGTSAYIAFFPEQQAAFAVLVNAGSFAGGWGAAAAVDVFETITGTEAEWKPWERFTQQVTEIKAERAAASEGGSEAAGGTASSGETDSGEETDAGGETPALQLSRPIGLYTGSFHHRWLGTLVISREGTDLDIRLGDRPLAFEPAGVDELRLTELTDPPAPLTFIVDDHGRVDRIAIVDEDWGEMIFER